MQTLASKPELLHVKQVAAELDVDAGTVRRWIHEGHLEAWRPGPHGRMRVHRAALERFLQPATTNEGDK
jgi:excisionase family DNA binding protein